jgi:hypothetical protein
VKREAELSSSLGWSLSHLNGVSHVHVSEISEDKATGEVTYLGARLSRGHYLVALKIYWVL